MDFFQINSKENKFYKTVKKLKQRKYREKEGLFLAEGRKFLQFSEKPEFIIINEEKLENYKDLKGENIYVFSEGLFREISSQENSQGIILGYKIKKVNIQDVKGDLVILDKVQDPGNLGTIVRTSDATGFKNLLLSKGTVDVYNEKTVRSSMGSIFNLNIIYVEEEELINFLKDNNYNTIVTALEKSSVDYRNMEIKEKNAFIFGNEGNGVSFNLIKNSNVKVKIPLYGSAESLNVAVATGVVLYKFRETVFMDF